MSICGDIIDYGSVDRQTMDWSTWIGNVLQSITFGTAHKLGVFRR